MGDCAHKQTRRERDFGFGYCVAHAPYTDCDPRAHGSVTYSETCLDCDRQRSWNENQGASECGTWHESVAQRDEREARQLLRRICSAGHAHDVVAVIRADARGVRVGVASAREQRWLRQQTLSWQELREAAEQPDPDCARIYQDLLREAKAIEGSHA